MATRLQPVDVVIVGMGFTGAILARELTQEGLSVVGLERGGNRDTVPDWQSPAMHDELRYSIRNEMTQNMATEAFTFRNDTEEEALPIRVLSSFLPGTDVGGAGVVEALAETGRRGSSPGPHVRVERPVPADGAM